MANRVKFMQESANYTTSVKFKEFIEIHSKKKIAVVVEGYDTKFYTSKITNISSCSKEWTAIICGGKEKVISLFTFISNHSIYKEYIKNHAYFVDADFDDNSSLSPDIYVTPCYSIENLYISNQCFSRLLEAEFGITEENTDTNFDYKSITSLFQERKSEFINHISEFNYWYFNYRKSGINLKLNLNNISIDDLVKINLDKCQCNYNKKEIFSLFKDINKEEISQDILNKINIISISPIDDLCDNKEKKFRGKNNFNFYIKFLQQLSYDANNGAPEYFSKKYKNHLGNLTNNNALSILSSYSETPNCLRNYITSIFN